MVAVKYSIANPKAPQALTLHTHSCAICDTHTHPVLSLQYSYITGLLEESYLASQTFTIRKNGLLQEQCCESWLSQCLNHLNSSRDQYCSLGTDSHFLPGSFVLSTLGFEGSAERDTLAQHTRNVSHIFGFS